MADPVKHDRRGARRAHTEARLVAAASRLFVARGYAATTLTDVAEAAGAAARTLYVHFDSKAVLLERCLEVAVRGDEGGVPIDDREWVRAASSATTSGERIARMARATAALMGRTGALLRVAHQAEAVEPTIAARAQAARLDTQRVLEAFWRRMAADGLLAPGIDVDWLAVTGAALGQAETFLVLTKVTDWDVDAYGDWLETTWRRLAGLG